MAITIPVAARRLQRLPRHRDAEVGPADLGIRRSRDGLTGDGRAPGVVVVSGSNGLHVLVRRLGHLFSPGEGRGRGLHLRQDADED